MTWNQSSWEKLFMSIFWPADTMSLEPPPKIWRSVVAVTQPLTAIHEPHTPTDSEQSLFSGHFFEDFLNSFFLNPSNVTN